MSFSYFVFYLIFVFIYIFKGISPIKVEISELLTKKEENTNKLKLNINNNQKSPKIKKKKKNLKTEVKIKSKSKSCKNLTNNNKKLKKIYRKSDVEVLEIKRKKKSNFYKKISFPVKKKKISVKSYIIKNNPKRPYLHEVRYSKKSFDKLESKTITSDKSNLKFIKDNRKETETIKKFWGKNKKSINILKSEFRLSPLSKKKEELSDFELNELEYFQALKLDKRSFWRIYWSLLRREHIILFTFCTLGDYNIIYVKLAKFVFLICQDMGLNVIFFSDDSMHKIYEDFGKYNFIQQIPQIIYSTIVSQIIQIILCYLSYTDKHFYQIKAIKNFKLNKKIVFKILRCIKFKLFGFFSFTFILFVFYWYFISCFCAVYQNTQSAFIKDSISSFLTGLLYPFILYLFPAILRIIALKDAVKKRLKCIYKLSDIIPFF